MKLILSVLLILFCSSAIANDFQKPLSNTLTVTREDLKAFESALGGVMEERNSAQEDARYFYGQLKGLKQCIMEHPKTAAHDCLDTL